MYRLSFKPVIDVLLALVLVVTLAWLIVLIFIIYGVSLEFPFFFSQKRIGKDVKPFTMYKFRTLEIDASLPLAQRKFLLGSILRATSLDELPQLWNVLRGEMSLIGPRPIPMEYGQLLATDQLKRFKVKPGITGWAQVNGRHGIPWQKKFELDNYYIDNQSFLLDLRILFKTFVLLLSRKKDVSLEEEPFRGN